MITLEVKVPITADDIKSDKLIRIDFRKFLIFFIPA